MDVSDLTQAKNFSTNFHNPILSTKIMVTSTDFSVNENKIDMIYQNLRPLSAKPSIIQ